ncbi:MAG: sarcosine oxidase subunit gamma [Alphaproteobacteria bacterium]|nr:sarcosine oxidase subunit gamma [Alphaproteobacteria bacterium]
MADQGAPACVTPIDVLATPPGGPRGAGIAIRERRLLGKLVVRGDTRDTDFIDTVQGTVGTAPPTTPNRCVFHDTLAVIWLGPDEWLVVTPPGREEGLLDALAAEGIVVTDVSDQSTVIRLTGPRAREVLAQGCALDLHPRSFRVGSAAQSRIGRIRTTLWQVDDQPGYDLLVSCSFAAWLWAWLTDAGGEFGVRVEAG